MAGAAAEPAGVRADLTRRIDAIDRVCDHLGLSEIAGELAFIRRAARASGIAPAVTVLHAMDAILSRGERGPRVHAGLAILRDAIDCPSSDARTCDTFAAACSVRLGG
jgi:hypothetical protein